MSTIFHSLHIWILIKITEKVNNVELSFNFTYEKESNNTIPFLDILIIKPQNVLTFKVYRKPTNKNDYIHVYFHHNNSEIKTDLIIVFFFFIRLCQIHADAVWALSWIFLNVFSLVWLRRSKISQEYGGWVGNETSASDLDWKYVGYPAISVSLFSQILIFFQLRLMCTVEIFFKRD